MFLLCFAYACVHLKYKTGGVSYFIFPLRGFLIVFTINDFCDLFIWLSLLLRVFFHLSAHAEALSLAGYGMIVFHHVGCDIPGSGDVVCCKSKVFISVYMYTYT